MRQSSTPRYTARLDGNVVKTKAPNKEINLVATPYEKYNGVIKLNNPEEFTVYGMPADDVEAYIDSLMEKLTRYYGKHILTKVKPNVLCFTQHDVLRMGVLRELAASGKIDLFVKKPSDDDDDISKPKVFTRWTSKDECLAKMITRKNFVCCDYFSDLNEILNPGPGESALAALAFDAFRTNPDWPKSDQFVKRMKNLIRTNVNSGGVYSKFTCATDALKHLMRVVYVILDNFHDDGDLIVERLYV